MIRTLFSLLLVVVSISSQAQLVINEVMSKNGSTWQDEDGDYPDWVELFNAGTEIESLEDYALTQDVAILNDWEIELTDLVLPGDFVVVFCSGKDRADQQELHSSFKLSQGEDLILSKNNSIVDQLIIPDLHSDVSLGRVHDGVQGWSLNYRGTPSFTNSDAIPYSNPDVSQDPGIYAEPFSLQLLAAPGHEVRYTLNCELPDENSSQFTQSITVADVSLHPERFSRIPTNPIGIEDHMEWEEPGPEVAKGTIIRYRTFYNGQPSSGIHTASYFVFPDGGLRYSLPLFSVVSDSLSFFSYDTGIYVPGAVHDLDPDWTSPWGTGNYHETGPEWERLAHIELFDREGDLEISLPVGMRIHGQGSRALPQKSLRFYARGSYGAGVFDHPIFADHSIDGRDVVVLRNMGQDFLTGVPVDVLSHEMAKSMGQEYLPYRPVIVFLNGEYWGIQNLRERFDEQYLAQYHSLPEHEIDLITSYFGLWTSGTPDAFWEMYQFIEDNDLGVVANYETVQSMMDIQSYTDHTLLKIFMGCFDWPGNNVKMWRPREPGSKFRWLLVDSDQCFKEVEFNGIEHATEANNPGWPNPDYSTLFLRKLLENENYREFFISRMDSLLQTEFAPDDLTETLLELKGHYESEYLEHQLRWHSLNNIGEFQEYYTRTFEFIRLRPCIIREQFTEFFGLTNDHFSYQCDSTYHVGITNLSLDAHLYPNPNSGNFGIAMDPKGKGDRVLKIYDLNGREVFWQDLNDNLAIRTGLNSGMFVVEIIQGSKSTRLKMIVVEDH